MNRVEGQIQHLLDNGLPSSVEAERAILGAILLDNLCYYQARKFLEPSDFSLDSHRRIFLRIVELMDRESPVDFVTLTECLMMHNEVNNVGGVAYVTSITDGLPRVKNIEQYVRIVKNKAMLRQLIHAANVTLQNAYSQDTEATEILTGAQLELTRIVNYIRQERELKDIARETILELEELSRLDGDCIGATTGLGDLDVLTTGFRNGELNIIGARPGNGKTAFACQGIRRNCDKGRKVGFFSSEVPERQVMIRLACMESKIPVFDTRDPRTLGDRKNDLYEAIAYMGNDWNDKLFIDDTPRIDIRQLLAVAGSWVSKGVELIYVDYLQILRSWGKDEYQQVTNAVNELWNFARSAKISIVALSQLNREAKNKIPDMSDLRNSGAIENFANLVLLLWRDLVMDEGGNITGYTGEDQIILAKQRSGPSRQMLEVTFDAPIGIFRRRPPRR